MLRMQVGKQVVIDRGEPHMARGILVAIVAAKRAFEDRTDLLCLVDLELPYRGYIRTDRGNGESGYVSCVVAHIDSVTPDGDHG